jgi:hypothetical protein
VSDTPDLPPDLDQLDRRLRGLRFEPRASLEAELLGRVRAGELPAGEARPPVWYRRQALVALAAGLVLAVGVALATDMPGLVLVDRCCFDLDGGGSDDDGVILLAETSTGPAPSAPATWSGSTAAAGPPCWTSRRTCWSPPGTAAWISTAARPRTTRCS